MDRSKNLILKNGKDITGDVILCKYNQAIQKYDITFQSGKTYSCGYHTIKWLRDPKILAPALARIIYGDE